MLKELNFAVGVTDYDKEYYIYNNDGIYFAEIYDVVNQRVYTKQIPKEQVLDKLLPFESLNLYKWNKDYYVSEEEFKSGDILWTLSLQNEGKRRKNSGGYGKFPSEWENFLKAINNVFPSFNYQKFIKK